MPKYPRFSRATIRTVRRRVGDMDCWYERSRVRASRSVLPRLRTAKSAVRIRVARGKLATHLIFQMKGAAALDNAGILKQLMSFRQLREVGDTLAQQHGRKADANF